MRDFLDAILDFIGSESLNDEEFATIELETQEYTLACYEALKSVLDSRESVSDQTERLKDYFQAAGVTVEAAAYTPQSNILIGGALS